MRGLGGFVRVDWDEVNEIIAAANVLHDQDVRVRTACSASRRFPAMSMVSYAAGARYLSR